MKGSVQITGRHSQLTGNDHEQELRPPMSTASSPDQSHPPPPLQTTVSYGIILSHGHKCTATSAKQQFTTSILYTTKLQFIGSRQKKPCSPLPPPLAQLSLCTELPLLCWLRWRRYIFLYEQKKGKKNRKITITSRLLNGRLCSRNTKSSAIDVCNSNSNW